MSSAPVVADKLEILDPPTEGEFSSIFRSETDPQAAQRCGASTWIAREEDCWVMVVEERGDLASK